MILRTIGFTGTIASGKTVRCHHLLHAAQQTQRQRLGLPLVDSSTSLTSASEVTADLDLPIGVKYINADHVGHHIYTPEKPCYAALVDQFGQGILAMDQPRDPMTQLPFIDRRALGSIVFADPSKLQQLNAICWPYIGAAIASQRRAIIEHSVVQKGLLLVIEAALLLEMGTAVKDCSDIWITHCSREEAIARVVRRDHLSEQQATQRVNSQGGLEKKLLQLKQHSVEDHKVVTLDTTGVALEDGLAEVEKMSQQYMETHFGSLF